MFSMYVVVKARVLNDNFSLLLFNALKLDNSDPHLHNVVLLSSLVLTNN